jgi:hypothetical protein
MPYTQPAAPADQDVYEHSQERQDTQGERPELQVPPLAREPRLLPVRVGMYSMDRPWLYTSTAPGTRTTPRSRPCWPACGTVRSDQDPAFHLVLV